MTPNVQACPGRLIKKTSDSTLRGIAMKSCFLLLRSYCLVASLLLLMAFRCSHAQQASSTSSCVDPEAHRVINYARKPLDLLAPSYQLEVCDDGTITYTGIRSVKTIGRVQFSIEAREVDPLFIALWKLDTGNWPYRDVLPRPRLKNACAPQMPYCDPNGLKARRDDRTLELNLPWSQHKTYSYSGGSAIEFDLQVRDLLEKYAPTNNLRCPVTVRVGFIPRPGEIKEIEVCASMRFSDEQLRKRLKEIEGESRDNK